MTKMLQGAAAQSADPSLPRWLHQSVSVVTIMAMLVGQVSSAYAQVATGVEGKVEAGTRVHHDTGLNTTVVTGQQRGTTDVAVFNKFQVNAGEHVRLELGRNSSRMVNIMANDSAVTINGHVRSMLFDGNSGGDIYFVTPGGFVLGATGEIHAGRLTVSTPTSAFRDALLDESDDGANFKKLFAGTEPLNTTPGEGYIEVLGKIEARQLSLRAGTRLLMQGNVTIAGNGAEGEYSAAKGVNTGNAKDAAGVQIIDGVISLVSKDKMTLGGQIKATNSGKSSAITAKAKSIEVLMDLPNASMVAGATGDSRTSYIVMFAENSVTLEKGVRLESYGEAGGVTWVRGDTISVGLQGSSGAQGVLGGMAGGRVTLEAQDSLSFGGNYSTEGASILLGAPIQNITGRLETRGGDFLSFGRDLTLTNATIDTRGTNASGLLALVAENDDMAKDFAISVADTSAKITIDNSDLNAGSILVSAYARAGNSDSGLDAGEQSQLEDDFFAKNLGLNKDGSERDLSDQLYDMLATTLEELQGGAATAGLLVSGFLPVNVPVSNVEAAVTIHNSRLTSDGRWDGTSAELLTRDPQISDAQRLAYSGLNGEGLIRDLWHLGDGTPVGGRMINLPSNWNASNGIFLQSHAENNVTVKPGGSLPIPASVGVAVMNTKSSLSVTGNSRLISAGDLQAYSTVAERLDAQVKAGRVADLSFGVLVTVQDVKNQLLIDAQQINVAGNARFAADTARSHSAEVEANAGKEGFIAGAFSVGISNSLTEAAVNARVDVGDRVNSGMTVGGDLTLNAHTVYFANNRAVTATVSLEDPQSNSITKQKDVAGLIDGLKKKVKGLFSKKEGSSESPSLGIGMAIDVNIFEDDTFASLGGGYHDLAAGAAYKGFDAGAVTAAGNLNVNAGLEYRGTGLLPGPSRNASAKMGDFGLLIKAKTKLANANPVPGAPTLTERELVGQHSEAVMWSTALSKLGGTTKAEIGGEITARNVNVEAVTDYGNPLTNVTGLWDSLQEWREYAANVSILKEDSVDGEEDGSTNVQPVAPDLAGLLGSVMDATSGATSSAQRSQYKHEASADDKKQELAIGFSLSGFMTSNDTTAAVLDGAKITTNGGNVDITAREEGVMIFANNMPMTKNPFEQLGEAVVGGTLNMNANHGKISALVGKAEINAKDLTITADNNRFIGNIAYAGGGGTGLGVAAAIGANVTKKKTQAQLSGDAKVRLDNDLTLAATDKSVNWLVSGGLTGGGDTAVGSAITINFMDRDVYAGITGSSLAGHKTVVAGGKASVTALNDAIDIGAAVAGAVSKATAKPAEDDEDSMEWWINPLFDADMALLIDDLLAVDTPATSGNASEKTGLALAGAVTLNLLLGNTTRVEIGKGAVIEAAGDIDLNARNTALTIGVSGAVSMGLDPQRDTDAMAGSLNWTQGQRDVSVLVKGDLTSLSGAVRASASDKSYTINVAVGGAGSSRGEKVIAGSVAGNMLQGDTKVSVNGAKLDAATQLSLAALDASFQLAVGGGVGFNMKMNQGFGMGLGVATNTYARNAIVELSNGASLTAAQMRLNAGFDATLMAFGISAGVGKTGIAGSVAVNTITSDAKVLLLGSAADNLLLKAAESAEITTRDNTRIWSLAGALSVGSKAFGAAASVNTIVTNSDVVMEHVRFTGNGTTNLDAGVNSTSIIRSLAAAGAVSIGQDTGVGAGIAVNTIVADAELRVSDSRFDGLDSARFTAISERKIASLSGGAAVSLGGNAAGFGLSVNVITSNDTRVSLVGSTVQARNLAVNAQATGRIDSLAVALSASKGSAIGGSVSVNMITGTTSANILGGTMMVSDSLIQSATDKQAINAIAGNAAVGLNSASVGVANATNIIAQDTEAMGDYSLDSRGSAPALTLSAHNNARIRALAATMAASGSSAAVGVSTAVGDIGNRTVAAFTGQAQNLGRVAITADNQSQIDILSGAAVASLGGAGIGGSVTIAMIHDTTLATMAASGLLSAQDITVLARKTGKIRALAAAGSAASSVGIAGSVVYTQIGRKSTVEGLDDVYTDAEGGNPGKSGQEQGEAAREGAMNDLVAAVGDAGSADLDARLKQGNDLNATDLTRAELKLNGGGSFGAIDVMAEDRAGIASLAGAVAGGGSVGVGVGIGVNLLFGATEALVRLPDSNVTTNGFSVQALQTGKIESNGIAAAGSGSAAVGAAIVVNVMQRGLLAQVKGGTLTKLSTKGGNVVVRAKQAGQIDSYALSAAGSGAAGVGGAFAVTYANDNVRARLANVAIDTSLSGPLDQNGNVVLDLAQAGDVTLEAVSDLEITGSAASAAIAGAGAVGGAVVVNVGAGSVRLVSKNLDVEARTLVMTAKGDRNLVSYSGAISGGFVGVGLATAVNVGSVTVISEHKGIAAKIWNDIDINTSATSQFGGAAVGLAAGGVAVVGTAVANKSTAVVETRLLDSALRSVDLAARGSLRVISDLQSNVSLLGGTDQKPTISGGAAVGGLAGAGVSVSVNDFKGRVLTLIEDGSVLYALAEDTGVASGTRRLHVASTSDVSIDSATVNFAGGLGAGSAVSSTIVIADHAELRIGDLDQDGIVQERVTLNGYPSDEILVQFGFDADRTVNAAQDTVLLAQSTSDLRMDVAALAVGAGAGGAAVSVAVLENKAILSLSGVSAEAANQLSLSALTRNQTYGGTLGAMGGFAGGAASVSTRIFDAEARVSILGSMLTQHGETAGGIAISAKTDSLSHGDVGAAAVAGAAGVGAIYVTATTNRADVILGDIDTQDPQGERELQSSAINAEGDIVLEAGNRLDVKANAIGGALGGFVGGVAANSLNVSSKAKVAIAAGQEIRGGKDLELKASDDVTSDVQSGGLVAGAVGMGLGIDIQRFSTSAEVSIGDDAKLNAKRNITLTATGSRNLQSSVMGGATGLMAGLSAAISSIDIGGTLLPLSAQDKAAKDKALVSIAGAMSKDNLSVSNSGDAAGADRVVAGAGAGGARDGALQKASALELNADLKPDTARVALGRGVSLMAGGDLTVDTKSLTDIDQWTGGLGAGGVYGIASGTGLIWSGSGAVVQVGTNSNLTAGGKLNVSAFDGARNQGIRSTAFTVAAGGGVAVGVGVARVNSSGSARIAIADDSGLRGGLVDSATQGVNLSALRRMPVEVKVKNVTVGGLLGAGVAVADAVDQGQASVELGKTIVDGAKVSVEAANTGSLHVQAQASTGGVGVAAAGADASATNKSVVAVDLAHARLSGKEILLGAYSMPSVYAESKGVAIAGGIAVGVSLARASYDANISTNFLGTISADRVTIQSRLHGDGAGSGVKAVANASAGGIAAGAGADAKATADYDVSSSVYGDLSAQEDLTILTSADNFTIDAQAKGNAGGVVAVGAVTAHAGQSEKGYGRVTSQVGAFAEKQKLSAGGALKLSSVNAPGYSVDVVAGAKGLGTGAAANGTTNLRLDTQSRYGDGGYDYELWGGTVDLTTSTDAALASSVDSRTASAVGHSGAGQKTTASVTSLSEVMGNTLIWGGGALDMLSYVGFTRKPASGGSNIFAGSGGLANGSAVNSVLDFDVVNTLRVNDGATLELFGSGRADGALGLSALNSFKVADLAYLDAAGAITVPRADVAINVKRGDALIDVKAANLSSGAGLRLAAGNEVDIHAKVDVSTTGVAGAAAGKTTASFSGNHAITIGAGAVLFAEQDIELLAGYKRKERQNFNLQAETRLYNKTALPIKTDPDADAIALDHAKVQIDEGAKLLAVRDIVLAAEGGNRDVLGFGLGKDLYRQVLAEIASAISGIFGGSPVSLDIKGGKTVDRADNGLVVNGTLRAGVRNIQVAYFDNDNILHYGDYADDEYARAQTTTNIGVGTSNSHALEARRQQVAGWIAADEFSDNVIAQAAWTLELARLEAMIAETEADKDKVEISVGNIRASAGNIHLRGDYMQGTGDLTAPGYALIDVAATSNSVLHVGTLVIDNHAGGKITFNDVETRNSAMIRDLTDGRSDGLGLTMISAETTPDKPLIRVIADSNHGILMLAGDVMNLGGTIEAKAEKIMIYGDARASVVDIGAKTNVSMEYRPGVRSTSGQNPEDSYGAYFKASQDAIREKLRAGKAGDTLTYFAGDGGVSAFKRVSGQDTAGIYASSSIFISADMVNVNSYLRAGIASYDINILSTIDADLAAIGGTSQVLLYDPLTGRALNENIGKAITSNAELHYDPLTKRIVVSDLLALGGNIVITGDIFSTGNGRIEVLDGFGELKLVSESQYDIELGRVFIGGELDENGHAQAARGTITLNDATYDDKGNRILNTTVFKRGENDPRTDSYQTKKDRDYIFTNVTTTQTDYKYLEKQLILVGGKVSEKRSSKEIIYASEPDTKNLASAPYLSSSLNSEYEYAVVGTLKEKKTDIHQERHKTHDSVRWYKAGSGWRHYEWTDRVTTVEQFEHRVKADHAIDIAFSGRDAGDGTSQTVNVNARGSVIFNGQVNNFGGQTVVVSRDGSILSGAPSVELGVANINLSAEKGAIGSNGGALHLVQSEGSFVTALAKTGVTLAAPRGDLRVGAITATGYDPVLTSAGAISLTARANLVQKAGTTISGGDISLTSHTAALGSTGNAIRVATNGAGRLSASAKDLINISQSNGDIRVKEIVSHLGDVVLTAEDGSILDGNDDVRTDFRSTDELKEMWKNQLGLTDGDSERFDALLRSYEAERNRLYAEYWEARDSTGEAAQTYQLDTASEQALQAAGLSESEIAAYESERNAFWQSLQGENARQIDYAYAASDVEADQLKETALYDQDTLLRSIDSSFVRETTSNVTENESPNIRAYGSISLTAGGDLGRNNPDYVIDMSKGLTEQDLKFLARALASDIDKTTAGIVRIRQFDDLNLLHSGSDVQGRPLGLLRAQAGGHVYLGSDGGFRLAGITSGADVTLRAGQSILDGRTSGNGSVINAQGNLVLQSASGSLGTADRHLSVRHGANGIANLRANDGIWLQATGDLALSEVYSPAKVVLSASGAIVDAYATAEPRIVAGDIALNAASIGTAGQGLGLRLLSGQGLIELATSQGGASVIIFDEAMLGHVDLAGDSRIVANAELSLTELVVVNGNLQLQVQDDLLVGVNAMIRAAGLDLRAASAGTDLVALQIEQLAGIGVLRMTSTVGDLNVALVSDARLERFVTAASGRLNARGSLALSGHDSIRFAQNGVMQMDLAQGMDVAQATGTHITGGSLVLRSGGAVGAAAKALITDLNQLEFDGYTAASDLYLAQSGDLELVALRQIAALSDLRLGGDLHLGQIDSPGRVLLDVAGALEVLDPDARHILVGDLTLSAASIASQAAPLILSQYAGVGRLAITTTQGAFHGMLLGDTRLAALHVARDGKLQSTGNLALVGQDTIRFGTNDRFELDLAGLLDLSQSAGTDIHGGSLWLAGSGDLGGVPKRLMVDLRDLSGRTDGDIHITAADDLVLAELQSGRVLDLLTLGDLLVQGRQSAGNVILSASRHLRLGEHPLEADNLQLFAFGGDITGLGGEAALLQAKAGARLTAFAGGDLSLRTEGDASFGYVAAGGDVTLSNGGMLQIAALGAGGVASLDAEDIFVGVAGAGQVVLADAAGLGLLGDGRYGLYDLLSPDRLQALAQGDLTIGLAQAGDLVLEGTRIDAILMAQQGNGTINLSATGAAGEMAEEIRLATVVAQDPGLLSQDPEGGLGLRDGLDLQSRDSTSLHASQLHSQNGGLTHSGEVIKILSFDIGGSYLVQRGQEVIRLSRVFPGIAPAVQLELWTRGDLPVNFALYRGQILEADPVQVIDMRRAGFVLNGREILSEHTMAGLAARLSVGPRPDSDPWKTFMPRDLDKLREEGRRNPWIFGQAAAGNEAL